MKKFSTHTKSTTLSVLEIYHLSNFIFSFRDARAELSTRNEEGYSSIPYLREQTEEALETAIEYGERILGALEAMRFYADAANAESDVILQRRNVERLRREVEGLRVIISDGYQTLITQQE